ncbi:MAG: hypothetical protein J6U00_05195 [Ruminococcus sp.]|uniref:hypothetical protein n=1 Tax=Ruminococcus sp. TaxID=41978 RepID=UPI001B252A1A|nr:hypothetical protein [Ruminococcus sp.]MBO7473385.1 hypothetical protein [Ruminococcus sp.]
MNRRIPQQMKIAYALVLFPVAILVIWCIYAAFYGYNYDFIPSLGNGELSYGFDGISEVLNAFILCVGCTPFMWIGAIIWIFTSLHFVARSIAYIWTKNFDMSQHAQDIFIASAALMDVMFIFGIIRVL